MASKRTKERRIKDELDSILGFDTDNTKVKQFRPNVITQIENNIEETLHFEIIPENYAQELLIDSPHQLTPDHTLFKISEHNIFPILNEPTMINVTNDVLDEFKNNLVKWVTDFNICQNALDGLLKVLRKVSVLSQLPKDSRTILQTRRMNETECLTTVKPGQYYHFGLNNAIQNHFKINSTSNIDVIKIVIGIDSLPISKSSSSQLWPILGYIRPNHNSVFPIGIYYLLLIGYQMPHDSNEYLEQFVSEAKVLLTNGININGLVMKVIIDGFSLDTPAKSFILKIKGHAGFDSCTRCLKEGEYLRNRTCFPFTNSSLIKRTHNDYVTRKHEEHHTGNIISILSDLPNIDIVNTFALDYMHLVCLGIMKKLIHLWLDSGPLIVRIQNSVSKKISEQLISLKSSIPCEFARKPRSLNELARFKATEFRQILLYSGQIIFKCCIKDECYKHFMSLNIAMIILLSSNMKIKYINYARDLLKYFVKNFEIIYGKHFISHNVHGLLHIADDYINFGNLDNISAFPFENYMKSLKKMIRKPDKPLQQIIKRNYEQNKYKHFQQDNKNTEIILTKEHSNGPLLNDLTSLQYRNVYCKNMKIKTMSKADHFVLTKDNNIMKVLNIGHTMNSNEVVLIGKLFLIKIPFYEQPINSIILDIYIVNNLSNKLIRIPLKYIKKKVILLEKDGQNIALPIIHSEY